MSTEGIRQWVMKEVVCSPILKCVKGFAGCVERRRCEPEQEDRPSQE